MKNRIIILLLFLIIFACDEEPGEGKQAMFALKNMYVLQDLIYEYRIKHNKFPDDLTFLNEIDVPFKYEIYETKISINLIEYRFTSIAYINHDSYFELQITYGPPGQNIIIYDKQKQEWIIYGYY
jgi:hypothetical protein